MLSAAALLALSSTAAAEVRLGEVYVDGTHGFRLRPPLGWDASRRRRIEPIGISVLRMSSPPERGPACEISVVLSVATKSRSLDETLGDMTRALSRGLPDVAIARRETRQLAGLPAADLVASFKLDGRPMALMLCLIQARSRQYFALTSVVPDSARPTLEPVFASVADTFRVVHDDTTAARIQSALLAGQEWLRSLAPSDLAALGESDDYWLVYVAGRAAGFVHAAVRVETYGGQSGLSLRERGWTFDPNRTARRIENDYFVSLYLTSERWQARTTVLRRDAKGAPVAADSEWNDGVREKDRLVVASRTERLGGDAGLVQPAAGDVPLPGEARESEPIRVPPTYASRSIVRLLPRLVRDPKSPRELAFHEYDYESAGLTLRTFEFRGAVESAEADGPRRFRVIEHEGFVGPPTEAEIDAGGHILLADMRTVRMRRTTAEQCNRRFGRHVRDAEEALRRLRGGASTTTRATTRAAEPSAPAATSPQRP